MKKKPTMANRSIWYKRGFLIWTALIIGLLVSCGDTNEQKEPAKTFKKTLAQHLHAIENRDLATLLPTVADSLTLIFPDGTKMTSKPQYEAFHKKWFGMENWEWKAKILKTTSGDSLGYGYVQYKYTERDSVGNINYISNAHLLLIFKKFEAGWQLIHDQNTKIPIPKK